MYSLTFVADSVDPVDVENIRGVAVAPVCEKPTVSRVYFGEMLETTREFENLQEIDIQSRLSVASACRDFFHKLYAHVGMSHIKFVSTNSQKWTYELLIQLRDKYSVIPRGCTFETLDLCDLEKTVEEAKFRYVPYDEIDTDTPWFRFMYRSDKFGVMGSLRRLAQRVPVHMECLIPARPEHRAVQQALIGYRLLTSAIEEENNDNESI